MALLSLTATSVPEFIKERYSVKVLMREDVEGGVG